MVNFDGLLGMEALRAASHTALLLYNRKFVSSNTSINKNYN